jgi:1-aminocyclopropane-1-carboxylate deaminase
MSEISFELLNEFFNQSIIHKFRIKPNNDLGLELFVKRDDLIHNEFSGNKLRKLKYNLKSFCNGQYKGIITFGGAYSNHLLATASACHYFGVECIGIVRGEELNETSNRILKRCSDLGMILHFKSRSLYDQMKKTTGSFSYSNADYWSIPEGGANFEGVLGCREIISNLEFDYFIVAQGTSTTSLGMLLELSEFQKLIVVPVLKGYDSINEMKLLLGNNQIFDKIFKKLIVLDQFHFGGYAKTNYKLETFVSEFNSLNQFQIESVYTGKVLFALNEWSKNIEENKKVLFVHTGGLHNYLK